MREYFKLKWKVFFIQGLLFSLFIELIHFFEDEDFNLLAFVIRFILFAVLSGVFSFYDNKRKLK